MSRFIHNAFAHCALILIATAAVLIAAASVLAESPQLQIRGRVELPGGAPAAGARILVLQNEPNQLRQEIRADSGGQFSIVDDFGERMLILAQTNDLKLQRRVAVAASEARAIANQPLRIELRPARQVAVHVTRDGQPVGNARVAIDETAASAVTSPQGEAVLLLPDGAEGAQISAWHPQLGIAGTRLKGDLHDESDLKIELALQQPQSRRIRVVDHAEQPVPRIRFWPNFLPTDADWFLGRPFGNLQVTTDEKGELEVAWAPKDLQSLDPDGLPREWVLEKVVQPTAADPVPVVHVRRKRPIAGRLTVPDGCDPTGLLIAARAFGPGNRADILSTRAAGDGTFSLLIASEFAYAIAIQDRDWTSEPLTGVLTRQSSADEPAPLELRVESATPLTIQATIGTDRKPLQDTYVSVGREIDSEWIDARGAKRRGRHGLFDWIRTDEHGTVRCGLGRGKNRIMVTHENWREEKSIDVKSNEPITLAFHKPYEQRRQIHGQLAQAGRAGDFTGVKIVALEHEQKQPKAIEIPAAANGRFELSTDCQQVDFFALDAAGSLCGNASAAEAVSDVTIELRPTATYEGEVLGRKDSPIGALRLTLALRDAPEVFTLTETTNAQGKFKFYRVFPGLPLRLSASPWAGKPTVLSDCYFEPAENRRGARFYVYPDDLASPTPPKPLAEDWPATLRDARLAKMHMLVAIHGDDPVAARFVPRFVLDYDEQPTVFDYLPLVTGAGELRASAADRDFVQKAGVALPEAKHVVLAAIDGTGKLLASIAIAADSPTAADDARKFMEAHRPPAVDGTELWRSALTEAKTSGRRVLVQIGGPRCGPCFRFSRWTEDHHEQLNRDYVIVKLQPGRQVGANEIETRLRGQSGSIPWTAIVDADENVLTTSDGPLGNIGFPSSVEGVRHFQRMLAKAAHHLTAEEIERLVATLRE
jgi:hypothetical protein